jgi:hypothetical protein
MTVRSGNSRKFFAYIFLEAVLLCPSIQLNAEPASTLMAEKKPVMPPNWDSAGTAKIESRGGMFPTKPMNTDKPPKPNKSDGTEATFRPEKIYVKRHSLAIWGGLPDVARLDYRYSLNSKLVLNLASSGPIPVNVDVEMPSDVIKSDSQKSLAVAYPAFNARFDVTWGPHAYGGVIWHPFGGTWYTSVAAGFRYLKLSGQAATPLRICSIIEAAKEPPCGNDQAALQTRNSIALEAEITVTSLFSRFATGWNIPISSSFQGLIEAGLLVPLQNTIKTSVSANIVSPDGTPEELSGALADLRSKSQKDLENKALKEITPVIEKPLPVLAIGAAYAF